MTPAEEVRAAVAVLAAEHPSPATVQALWAARRPLAALLESIAAEAERHAAKGWGNDQSEVVDGRYLDLARAINGGAP